MYDGVGRCRFRGIDFLDADVDIALHRFFHLFVVALHVSRAAGQVAFQRLFSQRMGHRAFLGIDGRRFRQFGIDTRRWWAG